MSTTSTPLAGLTAIGTSVWLDQIRRSMIETGELERLIAEDSVVGVTSNPSIFEKAILGSPDYDERLTELAHTTADAQAIYEDVSIADIQGAADVLHGVYESSGRADGYISLEVSPELARDTEGTLAAARDLWERVERPNAMIKIPGTPEGVPAIRAAIAAGININVTLLFGVDAYEAVADAYMSGLEDRVAAGAPIDGIASVASFFVSRVDTAVDHRLDELGHREHQGQAAVANARLAYARWEALVASERWRALAARGAMPQRLLWASTGTKNPHYSDTKYVTELAGPNVVNTMPPATLHAFQDHGGAKDELTGRGEEASQTIAAIEAAGIALDEVTSQLLEEGIDQFAEAMQGLLRGIERKRDAILAGNPGRITVDLAADDARAIGERVRWANEQDVAHRIWAKDWTLWGDKPDEIANRLGWLSISEQMLEHLGDVTAFVEQVRAAGFTDCALLGMGGSSLAPEVLRRTFGTREGYLNLHVLDSTHPDAVAGLAERVPVEHTLFIVSSKSGGTLEPRAFYAYFRNLVDDGSHFVAITDPGTALEKQAAEEGFRKVFYGSPEIGGRYSALSAFGIVPGALIGVDVHELLERAELAVQASQPSLETEQAPALWLGLAVGELALRGRDKLTFVVDPPIDSFGLWVEQLVAESTGKEGKGIVPVPGEPLGGPGEYGDDRVFLHLRHEESPDRAHDAALADLARAGHPVLTVPFADALDLGRLFFLSELATAVGGAVLGINPFDQPNVQEAKDLTVKTIEAYTQSGAFPEEDPGPPLPELVARAERGRSYVAIMAYVPESDEVDAALETLRVAIRAHTGAATTVGYGPRFLHSTGQLHKGGPPEGIFVQLVDDGRPGVEVPGFGYDFAALVRAQAIGDGQALRGRGLPFTRVHLEGERAAAIAALAASIEGGR
ncbi:MAG: transaldolase [Solirubrobacterales bacterium]|nr:transaldolase [Solirubrobacterales bacterium]